MKEVRICLFALLLMSPIVFSRAQTVHHASLIPEQSEVKILGSSNISSWEEQVEYFNISLALNFKGDEISGISQLKASLKIASIVSDYKTMTRKTHQALKAHEYPNIEYRLVSQSIITSKKGQFTGKIIGNITIAGVTKIISIPFSGILSGNKITISGTAGLNMNNFNIKPPTAMLGTVKTDTNITVTFHLLFHINR